MASGRLEVIRGRQGRSGLRGMSLSTFCDLAWLELWDDCPALGDLSQYREVIEQIFLQGKPPTEVMWTDHDGKQRPLGEAPKSDQLGSIPQTAIDEARALHQRMREMREAARVASSSDG
jgi:hypothetical protein